MIPLNLPFLLGAALAVASATPGLGAQDAQGQPGAPSGQSPAEQAANPQRAAAERLQNTRDALARWLETRKIISAEKREWALGKDVLADRIAVLEREIAGLRERIAKARKNITEADKEREQLVEENATLKAAEEDLKVVITGLEARTKALLKRLPGPALDRVQTLAQSIPDDPEKTKQSLTNRFVVVMGTLKELEKFHGQISLHSEVRDLADGTQVEVKTIYLGVSQGYYVTAKGDKAGIGTATAEGWVWQELNDAAPRIAEAVAILQGEEIANFVQLPIELR